MKKNKIKRILKIVLCIVFALILSSMMFYCFVAESPEDKNKAVKYILSATGFSVLIGGMLCAMCNYIEIEKLEENGTEKKRK